MQEENQGIHRFIRPGQLEYAIAYRIIALKTTDISMFTQASAKDMMLKTFIGPPCMYSLPAFLRRSLILDFSDPQVGGRRWRR